MNTFTIKTDAATQEWQQETPFSQIDRDECAREFALDERIGGIHTLEELRHKVQALGGFVETFDE